MKLIILSEQKSFIKKPRSSDCIIGQEEAFRANKNVSIVYKSLLIKNINRVLKKINIKPIYEPFAKRYKEDSIYFYIAMNLNYLEANKHILKKLKANSNKIALYIYDCWEPEFNDWDKVFNEIKPDYIFFCFKQTYEHYRNTYNAYWIPQSADLRKFKFLNLKKERKFIQIGRVNQIIHKKILEYLKINSLDDKEYVYRKNKNELLFPKLEDLVSEINKSKYIVCVPKCYENYKRTGNISGITARYFEAMACKTLIIGKKPISFDELFDENGMIEFNDDYSNFNEIINELENDDNKYNSIVENNYQKLISENSWNNRLEEILNIINQSN